MGIVLFAILGAKANVGAGYWICFAVYCFFYLINLIGKIIEEDC